MSTYATQLLLNCYLYYTHIMYNCQIGGLPLGYQNTDSYRPFGLPLSALLYAQGTEFTLERYYNPVAYIRVDKLAPHVVAVFFDRNMLTG
jgi:hypothetical protein